MFPFIVHSLSSLVSVGFRWKWTSGRVRKTPSSTRYYYYFSNLRCFDQNAWSTFRTGSSQHGRRSSCAYPWSATAIWFHDFSGNNVSAYWALRLFVRLCIVCSSIVDLFNWTLSLVYQESEHHLPHIHKNNNSRFRIDSDQIPHPVECSSNY